ncbi:MAG: cupin domain-containing protein [Bradymonadaceae bacterium]
MTSPPIDQLIERLELDPHPEGGYYRETWRADRQIPGESLDGIPGGRRAASSILYLLPEGETSEWHRLRAEEIWLHQLGDPLELQIQPTESAPVRRHVLGTDERLQAAVPARAWQRAEVASGEAGYALVGCVTVPGFEFQDFELRGESTD